MESLLVTLLVKLGVVASLASILVRPVAVQRMLLRENRTLNQRVQLALWFSVIFAAGVATRVKTSSSYLALDLSLEGCLLAGILGGYVTGLLSGVLISIPAMLNGELLSMPLLAAIGVLGGLVASMTWVFSQVDGVAGSLCLPYLAWVGFASYLNYSIVKLNAQDGVDKPR